MEQLSIFDVIYEFDENQAHWENVLDNHERCTVLAYIPDDALSPLEIPHRSGSKEFEHHKTIWGNYATAIWHYVSWVERIPSETSWRFACDRLKEFRNANKPCPMEITRSFRFKDRPYFKPEHVVEYL
jgi:hypothetical protein